MLWLKFNCQSLLKVISVFIFIVYFIFGFSVFLQYPKEYSLIGFLDILIGFLIFLCFIFLGMSTLKLKIWAFNLNIVLNALFIALSIFAYFPPFGFDNLNNPDWNEQFYWWLLTIFPSTLIILVIFWCQKHLSN